jgi:hypothetical protein
VRLVRLSESAQTQQTTRWNDSHNATQITGSRLEAGLGSIDTVAVLNAGLAQKYRGLLRVLWMSSIGDVGGDQTSDCTVGYQWSSTNLVAALGGSRARWSTSQSHLHRADLQMQQKCSSPGLWDGSPGRVGRRWRLADARLGGRVGETGFPAFRCSRWWMVPVR